MTQNIITPGQYFADPSVDFAFKRIFGTEKYKAATIGLLNSIIKSPTITDISFETTEVLGDLPTSRNSVIDVLCTADNGTKFIVEMQKAKQEHFRERMIFYTSKLIANQEGIKGNKFKYDIKPVHVVSFINFDFGKSAKDSADLNRPILRYKTTETELGAEMPGSSRYYFLNIPKFKKSLRI